MHELSIAQSILDIVREEMQVHGIRRLLAVRLAVGELSAVVPDSLHFCWGMVSEGTAAEGSRLVIEQIPVRARCGACGLDFEVRDFRFVCPVCEGKEIDLLSGRELVIQDLEVEDTAGERPRVSS